jgi:hypothetical protein
MFSQMSDAPRNVPGDHVFNSYVRLRFLLVRTEDESIGVPRRFAQGPSSQRRENEGRNVSVDRTVFCFGMCYAVWPPFLDIPFL